MVIALCARERREAEPQPKLRGACRACSKEVTAKCGKHVVWHWSHLATTHCDPWVGAGNTVAPRLEGLFPQGLAGGASPRTGYRRTSHCGRQNTAWPCGRVSSIPRSTQTRMRAGERFYGNMIWVVDGCRLPSDVVVFPSCVKDGAEDVRDFSLDRRSKLFQRWHTEKPVFMDFGRNGLWQCTVSTSLDPQGKLIWTPRSEFVKAVAGNTFDFSFEGGPAANVALPALPDVVGGGRRLDAALPPLLACCGTGGNAGLVFSRTPVASSIAAGPWPWMYGLLMFIAAVCAGAGSSDRLRPGWVLGSPRPA